MIFAIWYLYFKFDKTCVVHQKEMKERRDTVRLGFFVRCFSVASFLLAPVASNKINSTSSTTYDIM